MTWNHRVIKRKYETGEEYFAIHEVYYDDSGKPEQCTVLPISILQNSVDDLSITIDRIRECLSKPVLDYDEDFPNV
jgi:hypothetical protein